MKRKFLKGFWALYSIIMIVSVIVILFNKDFSFSGLYDYILGSNMNTLLNTFLDYFGSFRYFVSNASSLSDVALLVANGFMALLTALFLPIEFIIRVVGYFFI